MNTYNTSRVTEKVHNTVIEIQDKLKSVVHFFYADFSESDVGDIRAYLARQLPSIINEYRKRTTDVPAPIRAKYPDEETARLEWDQIMRKMICHFREMSSETCSQKNPYAESYYRILPTITRADPDETKIMEEYWTYEEKLRRYYRWNMKKGFQLLEEYGQYLFL